jgi:hypothetical protein
LPAKRTNGSQTQHSSSEFPQLAQGEGFFRNSKGTIREDGWIHRILFPNHSHSIPHNRCWSIALTTGHLIAISILVGGHIWQSQPGAGMAFLETYPNLHFMTEGAGLLLIVKLAFLCLIPFMWSDRFPILIVIIAIASVGSHMSRTFRRYSLLYGRENKE